VNNLHTEKKEDWKQQDVMRMAKNKKNEQFICNSEQALQISAFFSKRRIL